MFFGLRSECDMDIQITVALVLVLCSVIVIWLDLARASTSHFDHVRVL